MVANNLQLHRLSKIFQPISVVPKNAEIKRHDLTSKSQKLMLNLGLIHQSSPGCYNLLPLAVKALDKLKILVETEMQSIGGQKMVFPTLTNSKLWETTGRLKNLSPILFKVKDRHDQNFILSPTHEEAASDLLASLSPTSYKQLPLRLYQITSKYRDEMKPRFGLMRGKQFLMKDMYSFDVDVETSKTSYKEVCSAYDKIFKQIGVNFIKILGHSGDMGGELSHEYHYKADIGEDKIAMCNKCNYLGNIELVHGDKCPKCGGNIDFTSGIEVGHTFFLGDKYSKSLKATFLGIDGKPKPMQMGSYGLGLTRMLAAALEVLSTEQELRWPKILCPYTVVIIPPKSGSKEELHLSDPSSIIQTLYKEIEGFSLKSDVLIDDRTSMTIGRRYLDAKTMGYPLIIVLGNKITENPPLFELTDLSKSSDKMYLSRNELLSYIKSYV